MPFLRRICLLFSKTSNCVSIWRDFDYVLYYASRDEENHVPKK